MGTAVTLAQARALHPVRLQAAEGEAVMSGRETIELSGGPGDGCTPEVPDWVCTVAHAGPPTATGPATAPVPPPSLYRWRGVIRAGGRRVFEYLPGATDPLSPQAIAEMGDDDEWDDDE